MSNLRIPRHTHFFCVWIYNMWFSNFFHILNAFEYLPNPKSHHFKTMDDLYIVVIEMISDSRIESVKCGYSHLVTFVSVTKKEREENTLMPAISFRSYTFYDYSHICVVVDLKFAQILFWRISTRAYNLTCIRLCLMLLRYWRRHVYKCTAISTLQSPTKYLLYYIVVSYTSIAILILSRNTSDGDEKTKWIFAFCQKKKTTKKENSIYIMKQHKMCLSQRNFEWVSTFIAAFSLPSQYLRVEFFSSSKYSSWKWL